MENITVAIIWHKIIMICHFYVPYQLNYGLVYKMSKNYKNMFPDFPIFFAGDCETGQPHHDIGSQNLECYSIFPDFLMNFKISWPIRKFTDFFQTY